MTRTATYLLLHFKNLSGNIVDPDRYLTSQLKYQSLTLNCEGDSLTHNVHLWHVSLFPISLFQIMPYKLYLKYGESSV